MKRVPIVEEVHRIRERMWDESGDTLSGLIESLRASESAHPERVLSKAEFDRLSGSADTGKGPVSRLP